MRLTAKKQIFILLSTITILAMAIIILIVIPTTKSIVELSKHTSETQEIIEQKYQRAKLLKKSSHSLADAESIISKYETAALKKGQELEMITLLENMAEDYKIEQTLSVNYVEDGLLQGTPRNNSAKTNIKTPLYIFSFLNHGEYQDQLKYLRALERLPQYLIIENIQWNHRSQGSEGQNYVTLRFDAKIRINE